MDDQSRSRLDAFMGRIPIKPGHGSCCTCQRCGQYHDNCWCTDYDEWHDLGDLKEKIVEKGEGEEFIKFSYTKWVYPETQVKINPATILAIRSSTGFDLWLINPSIFIPLVDEWLKEKEAKDDLSLLRQR